ncbi:MAG: hypothetical protein WD048_14610 [Chitinophagales bacterium]
MISRAIIASKDLLLNVTEAQRMALFFDQILILSLERKEIPTDERDRVNADISFLREKNVIKNFGVEVPDIIHFGNWSPAKAFMEDKDIIIPIGLAYSNKKDNKDVLDENPVDAQLRYYAKNLFYNDVQIAAHVDPVNLFNKNNNCLNSLEVILNQVPLPPENIPWDDLIQFRNDEENKAKLRKLRIWLQKQASIETPPNLLLEELQQLLYEYEKYMEIQHKKYSFGIISTVITAIPEIVMSLKTSNYSSAFKALVSLRGQNLNLTEAELTAPGNVVSYISKVKKIK